jgi:hypothetical protein
VSGSRRTSPVERRDPRVRIAALALLERALGSLADDELVGLVEGVTDEQRQQLARIVGADALTTDPAQAVRNAAARGRMNGAAEAVVILLTDRVLADCIEQLGDAAELPSADDLRRVAPGLIERHGLGPTRLMLASAVCGEAPAAATIVQLLRHDEQLALPTPVVVATPRPTLTPEQEEERARVKAARTARREAERARKAKGR